MSTAGALIWVLRNNNVHLDSKIHYSGLVTLILTKSYPYREVVTGCTPFAESIVCHHDDLASYDGRSVHQSSHYSLSSPECTDQVGDEIKGKEAI